MPKSRRIALQERDKQILVQIAESPACSRSHIALSLFGGSYEAAKKRLQQLSREGLIQNNDETVSGRSILRITGEGLGFLESRRSPSRRESAHPVSLRMHKHESMLADCQVAFKAAIERDYDADVEFYDSERIAFQVDCGEHVLTETVRPDGFSIVRNFSRETSRHYFFFEIDRSTETQGHLVHLASQYRAYRDSGDFSVRFGNAHEPKQTTFRVLLIVKSRDRLFSTGKNLLNRSQIRTLIWISVFEDFMKKPFGPIWLCPLDFERSSPDRFRRALF